MELNVEADLALGGAPFRGHLGTERVVDPAVELVQIHRVNAFLQTIIFTLEAFNCLRVYDLLIGVAFFQRTADPTPAKCPELNQQENVWPFIRDNWL
jgi:hypothetical protein